MRRSNWIVLSVLTLISNVTILPIHATETIKAIPGAPTTAPAATPATSVTAPATAMPAATAPDPVMTCEAYLSTVAPPPKKKGVHPIRLIAKAVTSELGTDASGMLKDSMFVFSAKDFDPYDKQAPKNKPYTLLEMQLIDGSQASLIKYPDNSGKIVGGYADGTIIAPSGPNTFIMAYPNGARGKLVKVSGNEYDIYRPDNTITRITKTAGGDYEMSNNKLGYIGTARTDTEGMQFEMHSKDF
jgi:hypothetical protein